MARYKDKETQRAETYVKVSQLAEDMAKWVTRGEDEWNKYLTTAARIYKYPFHEQLLIHAQRPDATAVASVKIWNERMFCWVNKGAKGIALLDNDYPGENRLKYVFDVSDVHKAKRIGRDPNLWNLKEEYKDRVLQRLERTYGDTDKNKDFEERLIELAGRLAKDYIPDLLQELEYAKAGSYLEELDDMNLEIRVTETLRSSIAYTLLSRAGADMSQYKEEFDFSFIHEFNSFDTLTAIGTATSEMARPVLQEIGREIRAIEKENRTNIRNSIAKDTDIDYNALKRESKDIQSKGRGNENENNNIHTERGLSDSQYQAGRSTTGNDNTIRPDENEVPSGTQKRHVSGIPAQGYIKISHSYNPGTSRGEDGSIGISDGEGTGRKRGTESFRSDEVGSEDEQHQTLGRGDSSERDYLRIEQISNNTVTVGFKQMSLFPSETEQITNIKATEAGMHETLPVAFSLSKKQVNDILLTGGGKDNSRKTIFYQYQHGKSPEEMADFLKKEYGSGGKGFMMDGHPVSVWFDENGMTAGYGNAAKENVILSMNWSEIEQFTRDLVENGEYMSTSEAFLVDDIVNAKLANHIYFFFRDGVGEYPESLEITGSDYPKSEARLKELHSTPDGAGMIAAEMIQIQKQLQSGEKELRFHFVKPVDELIENVKNCIGSKRDLPTADNISLLQEDFFTQEEVDAIIQSGSGMQHGHFRIYEYLSEGHSTEENISFLKHEYGIGGKAPAIIGTDHSNEDHDAKGIKLSKGRITEPYLETTISWGSIEKRLQQLIRKEKYMSPKIKDEYEKYVAEKMEKAREDELNRLGLSLPSSTNENYDELDNEESQYIPVETEKKTTDKSVEKTNFHISDDALGEGSAKEKYKRNIEAIRTLESIESEKRLATPKEQEILANYVGWGGLADVFDEKKAGWASEYQELKSLLSPEEYESARESTLNAHYTSPVIIKAIYQALDQMGFKKGNILEPSMGIGNFFGMIPEKMQGSKLFGVELDGITGRIAKQLYQRANIQIKGFEKTDFPNDFFDVAIGNVPFGQYKVNDKAYDKHNFLIHDYFFAKTLDKVRPGGVIAFITSKGTMDKQSEEVRKYISQRAELLGAIRLPNTAFKANAGTEVTSDIIFLKKRDRMVDSEPDWVHLSEDKNGISMNS